MICSLIYVKSDNFNSLIQFSSADYTGCLTALEQLEILRPTDVKLAHNKIVAQCRTEGSPVQLSEVLHQLEGLAKTAGNYHKISGVIIFLFLVFVALKC